MKPEKNGIFQKWNSKKREFIKNETGKNGNLSKMKPEKKGIYQKWNRNKREFIYSKKTFCMNSRITLVPMVSWIWALGPMTRVQNLDETVCILLSTDTLGKGMNPTILPPARGKIVGDTGIFNLDMATGTAEGKLWIPIC